MTNSDKRRDTTVTKQCENCSKEYHPRHGYQGAARFCCQECFRLFKAKGLLNVKVNEHKPATYEIYKPKTSPPGRLGALDHTKLRSKG